MSSPTCTCCRRWNKVGIILHKLLLEGVNDEDCGGRCTNTTNDGNGTLPSLFPQYCNTIHQGRRLPIPIQLRLAIVRCTNTNFHPGNNNMMAEELGPTLLTHFPPLRSCEDDTSSSFSSNTVATISEFMQYVVEDLFIGNREAHFLVHGSSHFVSMLLGDSNKEGRDSTPVMVFRYGGKKKNKISGEGGYNNCTSGQTTSICTVQFSLLDETEGNAVIISPLDDAYETFSNLILAQSKKKLDLMLKAHVRISSSEPLPPPTTTTKTTTEETSQSNVLVPAHNRKRKSISFADDEQIPKRGKSITEFIRINGIPPALSEALENQKAAPSLVNSNVRKSEDILEVPVNIHPSQPKDANHTESDVADEDMISAPKNADPVDAGEVGDEILHDAFKGAENLDGDVGETMIVDNIAKQKLESVQTIDPNAQGEELSADDDSSSSSSSNEDDEAKDDVETIGKSSSEEDDGEEVMIAVSKDGNQTSTNLDVKGAVLTVSSNNETNNISDSRIEIDAPDAAEEGNPEDSSSSSDDGSSSSDDDDDSEILLSQSSNIAPTNEQSSEILVTNIPFASGKTTTPAISAVDNNAIFTQESELVPTILFEEIGDEKHLRGKDMIRLLAYNNRKRDDDSSSSSTSDGNSSSSSSSSSSSDESDDEDDKRDEVCNIGAEILRVVDKNAVDATSPNKDSDESSSSSSSTGSSSSSDSSSDSDSDSDSSSSKDDGEKKAQQNSPVSGNIPPVVQSSSRGRRRAPLVPANRKIVINTSTVGNR